MKIRIDEIRVKNRRKIDEDYVMRLAESIESQGLLNPITVNKDGTLIAGGHRLEAVKLLGESEIECHVVDLDKLHAELAEIDENLVRHNLNHIEEADQLLRRKEIYEKLHPDAKAGVAGGRASGQARGTNEKFSFVPKEKPFTVDAAEKLGVAPRTVEMKIQVAKNLIPEVKAVVKESGISRENALKLARIKDKDKQKEAAEMLATKKIRTVDEYTEPRGQAGSPVIPFPDKPMTIKETIADLKNPNKDCSCTPEILLLEYDAYIADFVRGIAWYETERYADLYSQLTEEQREHMTMANEAAKKAISRIKSLIERNYKNERLQKA